MGLLTASAFAADRPAPPRLPIAAKWSVDLTTAVASDPVADGDRVFLALRSAHLVALRAADGGEAWRVEKTVSVPFAAADGLVFIAADEAIEALSAADGRSVWLLPRVKAVAPLVVAGTLLFAVTAEEIVAVRAADGAIAWRQPAGGVDLPPAIDGTRVYLGAKDGRIIALDVADGTLRWEKYVRLGVTAIGAGAGRVYAGAGDKRFHCLNARSGSPEWSFHVGALINGRLAVDGDRVYFSALDNVVRALDRATGNQRWKRPLNRRPIAGVRLLGHVVFVPIAGAELVMLYDHDGVPSGIITLAGDTSRDTPPAFRETEAGLELFVVTGGLSNLWKMTHIGPAGEAAMVPFASMDIPGAMFLTDPVLAPIAQVLPWVLGDPVLQPLEDLGWPLRMDDPPLVPLTTLPGLQLRPLSPVLPPRRGA
ncbi:MAG TPA: PQQ-binding-like beta-propeller repeat protein [Vicinamibacterales bacterium]|nr:PQQ-binding-like beta-propeller repeat protein [Vicinamibacterales bacterium]